MHPRTRRWIRVTAVLVVAQIAASLFLPRGFILTAVSDLVCALLMLSVAMTFARNARLSRGRLRKVWILLSSCAALWLADECAWLFYDVVLRKPMPVMFPGDAVLFLAGVPTLAALLLRPHLEPSRQSLRFGMIDFLQLILWWIYLYAYLVLCWQYVGSDPAAYNQNYDSLYLVEILAQVGVLCLLILQSSGPWRRYYALFLGAVAFNSLSVFAADRAIEIGTYYGGSWYDTPFVGSLAFFVVVALRGRRLKPVPENDKDPSYATWMANLAGLAVLSLPVIVVVSLIQHSGSPEVTRFRVTITAITLFLMAALVILKQRRLHQELKRTNRILEEASMTDPLTGVRNRRFFSATIEGDVAQVLRAFHTGQDRTRRDLVFYLIDMDNFKEVNDHYGHQAGDRVLVESARRIESVIRDSDVLLRWGGEEFLVVSRLTDRREADALAVRVMQAIRTDPYQVAPTHRIRRTCSIGWAAFPWQEDDLEEMGYEDVLNQADRALHQAKRAGKDQAIGMTPLLAHAHAMAGLRRDVDSTLSRPAPRKDPASLHVSSMR